MYSRYQRMEAVVRLFFVFVFLTTTLVPSPASAASFAYQADAWFSRVSKWMTKPGERPLLENYNLGQYASPYSDDAPPKDPPNDPDPKPNLPDKGSDLPISFILEASPGIVGSTGETTLIVTVKNNSTTAAEAFTFTDKLEKDFTFISSDSKIVSYGSKTRQVSAQVESLGSGEEIQFSYTLKVESKKKADNPNGNIIVHTAEIKSKTQSLKAETELWLDFSTKNKSFEVNSMGTQGGWIETERASVYFEPDALDQDYIITEEPTNIPGGPPKQFKLELHKTETAQVDIEGKYKEQKVKVLEKKNKVFEKPVYMEIDFEGIGDLSQVPPGKEPYVVTYYQERDIWVKVPILDVEHDSNKVLVKTNHFSTWGAGLGDSLPQNGANVLLFDQPYTSLFTGAARYSIPIWTPAGRAEMAPDVTLAYSSSTVNGVLGDIQSPWVGVGWNIDGIEIVRMITTDENGYGYVNNFSLTYNGTSYELIPDLETPSKYYTKESSFLYVERHNTAFGNDEGVNNTTKEWWEVVATDGTRYRLGWNIDSETLTLMEGYACNEGEPCHTPEYTGELDPEEEDPYAPLGFAGIGEDLVASRWRVDRIQDTHGNYIEYTYHEEQPDPNSNIAPFDRASYIETISYTGYDGGGIGDLDPGYQLVFKRSERDPLQIPSSFSIWDHYDTQYLSAIEIYQCDDLGGCDGYTSDPTYPDIKVRTYELGYETIQDGWESPQNYTLALTSLSVSGGGYTEDGITIPATEAATISFDYQNYNNIVVADPEEDNIFKYPRLVEIDNGYGGSLEYHYIHDGRDHHSWLNYRVGHVEVSSGQGILTYQGYSYQDPKYQNSNGTGALIGHENVTEVIYNNEPSDQSLRIMLRVKHEYGTEDLDIGNELSTQWLDPANEDQVIRKTVNTYATDNSQAPSENWNFHYLYSTTNFERKGEVLSQINKTTSLRHPGNGNLVVQNEYLNSSLYRKKYFEYIINDDPDVYILDRVSRQLLTDANENIISETVSTYDNGGLLTLGELTLSQTKTGTNNQSVDAKYIYDDYGNMVESRGFQGYGSIGTNPSGTYQSTSTTFDNVLYTYPTTITNELNQSTDTDYLFTLGLPYQVTDASNIITSTEYDGLGRVLSVSVPTYNQIGSDGIRYTYPTPNPQGQVSAPYSIKMEILDTHPSPNAYRSVWGIYDGLGRIIQNQVQNDDNNKLLISNYRFNAQGQVDRESTPVEETATGGSYQSFSWSGLDYSTTKYDLLGRVTKTKPAAGEDYATETSYDGLTTSVIDAEGHKISQTVDGFGRLIKVQEYSGNSAQTHSLYATTQYSYDVADRLVKVVDAQSNQTLITYDALGRKLQMVDPDMGTWDYLYDPTGNLTQQIDARNEGICFYYDGLNRLTGKYYHDQSACPTGPTLDVSFTYDDVSNGNLGIGKRTGMVDEAGSTSWFYEDSGRTVTETRTIDAVDYSFETTSDWLGRVEQIKYPDNEEVTYGYDALGRVDTLVDGSSSTLADLAYNVLGQITQLDLGNETQISNTYDFSDNTYRLTDRIVDHSSTQYIDFDYFYDDVGNITQINDHKLDEILTYDYDDLNRLTSADAFVGSDFSYRQRFDYDKVGNILKVREWDEDVLFKDDFGSGDLTAWSSNSNDEGDLVASSNNVYIGDFALEATIDDTNSIYVQDDSPDTETRYRARFYLDPNSITMSDGDVFTIFSDGNADTPVTVIFGYTVVNGYAVQIGISDDTDTFTYSSWYELEDDWQSVEIDWAASSAAEANDGYITLWIDGSEKETVDQIDNDSKRFNQIRLGLVEGLDAGTTGTLFFDAFESRNATYIGLLPQSNPISLITGPAKVSQNIDSVIQNSPVQNQDIQSAPTAATTPTPEELILANNYPINSQNNSGLVYVNYAPSNQTIKNKVVDYTQTTIGEFGKIEDLTHNLQTVILSHSFTEPVVFIGPLSNNDPDPAVVRVTNVQSDRFNLYIQDATNVDGDHIYETVSYLVLEAGSWVVDGKKLEVGKVYTKRFHWTKSCFYLMGKRSI